jgi:hypothetical protein
MSHPTAETLRLFVDGTLVESEVVEVALHLDACPRCAQAAARQDPLDLAFAALDEPAHPPELAQAALAQASTPVKAGPEMIIATLLLLAGLGVLLVLGAPVELLTRAAVVLQALRATVSAVTAGGGLELLWLGLAAALLLFSVIAARRLDARRSA